MGRDPGPALPEGSSLCSLLPAPPSYVTLKTRVTIDPRDERGSEIMIVANGKRRFPCPVCTDPREVRLTKKDKPYIVCDPCGVGPQAWRSKLALYGFRSLCLERLSGAAARGSGPVAARVSVS